MSKLCFLLGMPLLILLASCMTVAGQPMPGKKKSITDMPLLPHNREVDVYFKDDKPKEPYYKIEMVEVHSPAGTSTDDMLVVLKRQAQLVGYDGVMMGDISKQTNNLVSYTNPNGIEISYQKLQGIGIRYRSTIDYMDKILKEQSVSLWSDDNSDPKQFTMKYDYYGNNLSLADQYIYKFFDEQVYPFEGENNPYAAYEGWKCTYNAGEGLYSKKKDVNEFTTVTGNFYYVPGKLKNAEIELFPTGFQKRAKWQLTPVYNSEDQLTGRQLMNGKSKVWEDAIFYRLNGLQDRVERTKMVNGKRVLVFVIKNTYYSADDLPAPEQ